MDPRQRDYGSIFSSDEGAKSIPIMTNRKMAYFEAVILPGISFFECQTGRGGFRGNPIIARGGIFPAVNSRARQCRGGKSSFAPRARIRRRLSGSSGGLYLQRS